MTQLFLYFLEIVLFLSLAVFPLLVLPAFTESQSKVKTLGNIPDSLEV